MDGRPESIGTSLTSGAPTAQRSSAIWRARSPTETMLVTPDGVQAPYFTAQLTDKNARTFLRDNGEYINSVDRQ